MSTTRTSAVGRLEGVERLLWIDLETTGLRADSDEILEIAVVATTCEPALREVAVGVWVRAATAKTRSLARPEVRAMHDESGLWAATLSDDAVRFEGLAENVAGWLATHIGPHGNPGPLCGSSVHFDRGFVEYDLPIIEEYVTHRNFDVSTLWAAREIHGRRVPAPPAVHRALADVRASIDLARSLLGDG